MEATVVDPFVFRLAIFVLAIFIGYYVVWSVTPALHQRHFFRHYCWRLDRRRADGV